MPVINVDIMVKPRFINHAKTLMPGIWLTDIYMSARTVILHGRSPSRATVSIFIMKIFQPTANGGNNVRNANLEMDL